MEEPNPRTARVFHEDSDDQFVGVLPLQLRLGHALILLVSIALTFSALALAPGRSQHESMEASIMADTVDPVAVIRIMNSDGDIVNADMVSNGTEVNLDGSGSSDDSSFIMSYLWEIEYGGNATVAYSQVQIFKFRSLGTYLITLTVTDAAGNNGSESVAVTSVLDSDSDDLPDWWEDEYFGDLLQDGAGNPDGDGYDNLQEFAQGTDPTVFDEQPPGWLEENWYFVVAAAAAPVVTLLTLVPFFRTRQRARERRKIDAAIEIHKALEDED